MRTLPIFRRIVFRSIVLACLSAGCTAPEQSVRPGVNKEYQTTPASEWVQRFESESREIFHERQKILDATGVRENMVVADVGAGTGFFTEMFSQKVGMKGRVYAVDITPAFLEQIRKRASEQHLSNVTTILCTERDSKLPANSVDLAFVCDTYHHFEYPHSTLSSIRRALKRGGRLVVVDFDRIPGKSRQWVLDHVRVGKDVVRTEIEAAGFVFEDQPATPFLTENYVLRFKRG